MPNNKGVADALDTWAGTKSNHLRLGSRQTKKTILQTQFRFQPIKARKNFVV